MSALLTAPPTLFAILHDEDGIKNGKYYNTPQKGIYFVTFGGHPLAPV